MTRRETWVRADHKRPITTSGRPASSTDPSTWTTFDAVRTSTAGDGLGIMLGAGLGCYDLDHCRDPRTGRIAQLALADLEAIREKVIWAEVSQSGTGVHVFVRAPEAPGWRRGGVERYTRERFIRLTGVHFDLSTALKARRRRRRWRSRSPGTLSPTFAKGRAIPG
jgi:primase-polymerase (primpol)-like protein